MAIFQNASGTNATGSIFIGIGTINGVIKDPAPPIKPAPTHTFKQKSRFRDNDYSSHETTFSHDGKRVVSTSSQCLAVRVWDANTGAVILGHEGLTEEVTRVGFNTLSPDGKVMISGPTNSRGAKTMVENIVTLWDLETCQATSTLVEGHAGHVAGAALSPNGKKLVTSMIDYIQMWDLLTGKCTTSEKLSEGSIAPLVFSPDGKRVVSIGGYNKWINIWDAETLIVVSASQVSGSTQALPVCAAFSPDGKTVVLGLGNSKILLMEVETGNFISEPTQFEGHEDSVRSIAFSPDGKWIASGSWDKTVNVWDAAGYAVSPPLKGHTSSVESVAFSPSGRDIVPSSWNDVRLWTLQ